MGSPRTFHTNWQDLLNEGLPPTWEAFASGAGGGVIAEALAAAEDVDGTIAGLPESTPIDAILAERPALLDRSIHRREHVKQLEKLLAGRRHHIERALGE